MFAQHMLAVCKTDGNGCDRHASRRALPRRRGEGDPQEVPRTGPDRGDHRPAAKPVLRRGHSGLHSRHAAESHRPVAQPEQAREPARPGALHQCRRRVPCRPRAELSAAGARREDRFHLRPLRGHARLRAARAARRDQQPGQRLEPQHPPLRGQLAAARAARRARASARRRAGGRSRSAAAAVRGAWLRPCSRLRRARKRHCSISTSRPRSPTAPPSARLSKTIPVCRCACSRSRDALAAWWVAHSARLADLPQHRELNRVRSEFLDTFVTALAPLGTARPLQARWCHRDLVDRHTARFQDAASKTDFPA